MQDSGNMALEIVKPKGGVLFVHNIQLHYSKKKDYFYPHGEAFHSLNWDDILRFLQKEVDVIEKRLYKYNDNESPVNHAGYSSLEVIPDRMHNESLTDPVLIDTDGNRKNYVVGYYNQDHEKWILSDPGIPLDMEHGVWCYLPLSKYDKK